jgi:hypothetical protein
MLQGDTNILALVVSVTEFVLYRFIGKFVEEYLDYISIYSDTLVDHIGYIQAVCQCLQCYKVIVSLKKCNFFTKRLNLLQYHINENGVYTEPEKIWGIQYWPIPKSRKELQCLNGPIIYHAQYLSDLATGMARLTDLVSEDKFE